MKNVMIIISLLCVMQSGLLSQDKYPPGVVINHIPKSTGKYIGSPSLCILPDGNYVASHDEFGPQSSEYKSAVTNVFRSADKGKTWTKISRIEGQFWSNLFVCKDDLYIIGTNKHHGNLVIRKSTDGGKTWTVPCDSKHGLLLEGEYHTAPVPVVVHAGRIWRAVEYATAKTIKWGERYSAMVISAPVNSDLLDAGNWRKSNRLPYDPTYLNGNFKAWLEGNVVRTKAGKLVEILRVHTPDQHHEYCAVIDIDKHGKKISFNENNFYPMPGASKKFTIRYDENSGKYWSLVNSVGDVYKGKAGLDRIRNELALVSSDNLTDWNIEKIVLFDSDYLHHGFQYADWVFDGDDIVFASRTAYDDEEGGAERAHDANYLTFHRISGYWYDFR